MTERTAQKVANVALGAAALGATPQSSRSVNLLFAAAIINRYESLRR